MKVDEIINKYVTARAVLDAERKKYKAIEKAIKADMLAMELQIMTIADELGVDSLKSKFGTAYTVTKKFASLDNRERLIDYVKETGDFGLFTSHVNKAHLLELMDDRIEPIEIGISYTEERSINIRKS